MIIQEEGFYAILNDSNNTFKEWQYLTAGTECADGCVLPRETLAVPTYDEKLERLNEVITIETDKVIQNWQIENLTPQEIENRKKPDCIGFQKAMININNTDLFTIYSKILATAMSTPVGALWYGEIKSALIPSLYTKDGFSMAITQLTKTVQLSPEEIVTVNKYLYHYDLELIK